MPTEEKHHSYVSTREIGLGLLFAVFAATLLIGMMSLLTSVASAGGGGIGGSGDGGSGGGSDTEYKFPVRGSHNYGDGFGANRGHQGQDVFARCGTKLVAAHAGKVVLRDNSGAAGKLLMIQLTGVGKKVTHVYMHMNRMSVRQGDRVATGEKIGTVGDTGNASGCHLHMEKRTGGYTWSGKARPSITRDLKAWDRTS